jgi:lipopolysaccharide transport system ATP-binding protein
MAKIINVENLGKRYRIGTRRSYGGSLRDSLGALLRGPFNLVRSNGQKSGEEFWALKDVGFSIEQGEVVGIIGRNGAGKSTLLKILSRITEPTTGRVELFGRVGSLLEVGTGFHPELNGRENIYLNGSILGMRRKEIDRKFDEIVAFAEVDKFIDTPVKHYSSGMYVRLAFAVAAHLEPEILIVDEVLAVGDTVFQRKCLGKMGDVAKEGRTVLFVSHNMAAVQNLCQRAIYLTDGTVAVDGPTDMVIGKYIETSSTSARVSLSDRTDRKGTGDVRFTSLVLRNAKGEDVKALRTGEASTLVFYFQNTTNRELKNFHLAVGLDDKTGQRITVLSNEVTDQIFPRLSPDTKGIEVHIERLPLMHGKYGFTLYCTVNGVVADWIQNAGFFEVDQGDFYDTGQLPPAEQGNFLVPHHFKVSQSDDVLARI